MTINNYLFSLLTFYLQVFLAHEMYNGIILETSEIYFTLIYASKGYQLHNILIDFEGMSLN